jgi:predicted phage terminase large subunit-like protein
MKEFTLESIQRGEDRETSIQDSWTQIEARIKASANVREQAKKEAEEKAVIQAEIQRREALDAELASRALARRSLLHYVERRVPNYKAGWVHEDIARRIESFVEKIERGESPRLILQVAPRSGKSELASISGPAWILAKHPDWTVMLTSYSDELPISWSRSIREQLKTEEFRTLFPNGPVVSKIDAGAKAWSTEQGGGVRASGVGGSILGFGAQVVVVDDPIKGAEEADSPGLLEKNWDWATSALYSRLMPGGGLLIIQQRWSNEDLVGRFISQMEAELQEIEDLRATAKELRSKPDADSLDLEEANNYEREAAELEESMDKWDVISYPALAEQDEYLSPEGDIVRFTPYEEVPTGYKLLRKTGEALHPERYGRNYYLKLKRANPRRFAALYQQTPIVDEGQYFAAGDLKRYSWKELPSTNFMNKFAAWDLAIGTKQSNDYTVGIVGGYDHEGRLWLLERIRGRFGDLEKVADMVLDLHLKHDCVITGIERTHLEMALHPILKRKMRDRNTFILLAEGKEALKPISDKFVRARQLQALAKAGMVYVPDDDSWNDFVQELIRFGSSKTDDQVDAAAWLTIMAAKYALPDNPDGSIPNKKSWYEEFMDEYLGGKDGGEKAFMGA